MKTTVAARLPSHLFRKFVKRVEELGISRSQALVQAVEAWLEGATAAPQKPAISNNSVIMKPQANYPQVPQIIIVIPQLPQGQIVAVPQVPQQVVVSSPQLLPSSNKVRAKSTTSQSEVRKEDAVLVVPRDALIAAEANNTPGEAQDVLEEITSNPWFDILSKKGGRDD